MKLLYLFPDPAMRLAIPQAGHRYGGQTYAWYGMDWASRYGHEAKADIDYLPRHTLGEKLINRAINVLWFALGGSGGNWYRPLALRGAIKKADLIISTADRVGLPLVLLMAVGLLPKRPILYISIGLPEHWKRLSPSMRRLYRRAFQKTVTRVVCYGYEEWQRLRTELGLEPQRVHFIPFGVDTDVFTPVSVPSSDGPILSIGADPNRDFDLLIRMAPNITEPLLIVTSTKRAQALRHRWNPLPANVSIRADVPFSHMPSLMAQSRFLVLPLHDNSYSGATTTLLQGMAMGKLAIVSRTGAIAQGYHLIHKQNLLFVEPEQESELLSQIQFAVDHPDVCQEIGEQARRIVSEHLRWDLFVAKLFALIDEEPVPTAL